jgi:hypothetical protein
MFYYDLIKKEKIKEFSYSGIPVTKAKISPDGKFIAYSLGYDWSEGIWGIEK